MLVFIFLEQKKMYTRLVRKKHQIDSDYYQTILRVRSVLPHFAQYFIYIMAVCIIGREIGGVEQAQMQDFMLESAHFVNEEIRLIREGCILI